MANSPYSLPDIHVDTFANLSGITGIIGQKAITEDTMVSYVFDGTNWVDSPLRKLTIKSGTPTITMAAGAGSGATGSIVGNNAAGTITITTGLSLGSNPDLFTITLADGASFPTKLVPQILPVDINTVGIANVFPSVATAISATIKSKGLSLSVNTTYTFSYIIMGY